MWLVFHVSSEPKAAWHDVYHFSNAFLSIGQFKECGLMVLPFMTAEHCDFHKCSESFHHFPCKSVPCHHSPCGVPKCLFQGCRLWFHGFGLHHQAGQCCRRHGRHVARNFKVVTGHWFSHLSSILFLFRCPEVRVRTKSAYRDRLESCWNFFESVHLLLYHYYMTIQDLDLYMLHQRLPWSEVIGPSQWDEDVLGIYWTLVMGSAASEKHEKEERTKEHEVRRPNHSQSLARCDSLP